MFEYIRRLVTTGVSYTASSVISKLIAVALLPVYTRFLSPSDYGSAEVLLASVIVISIFVRFGIVEALMRFYYRFDTSQQQQAAVKASFTFLLISSTLGALVAAYFAGPLSELFLGQRETELMLITVFGFWVFTNYELLLSLFRLDERARDYFLTSLANVLLTVALTVWFVVVEEQGAKGLLLGNFIGSAVLYIVLVFVQHRRIGFSLNGALLKPMLRFGIPTMPAEISIFSMNFIDRFILARSVGLAEAGLYSIAVKFSQVVTVLVRAFQLAWPPLAYSIRDDDEARGVYAVIVTYYVLICSWAVVGLALLSRWLLRLLVAEQFFDAYKAIPLVATGVTLYGLYLVLVVIMGRVGRTEYNFPVSGAATAVNIGLNLILIPAYGIVGAGVALVISYLVMLSLMYFVSQRYFSVPFQWLRLAHILGVAVALVAVGELFTPTSGAVGLLLRGALVAAFPVILYLTGFLHSKERERLVFLARKLTLEKPLKRGEALEDGPELVRELHNAQDPD